MFSIRFFKQFIYLLKANKNSGPIYGLYSRVVCNQDTSNGDETFFFRFNLNILYRILNSFAPKNDQRFKC